MNTDVSSCLNYPFDVRQILQKKKALKRDLLAKKNQNWIEKKIAILGGSTTAEIKDILELFLLKDGIRPIFYESGYGKYYEEAVFGSQELQAFKPDIVYIHTTNVNISSFPEIFESAELVQKKLVAEVDRYKQIWTKIENDLGSVIIQNNFELPRNRPLGNLDASDERGKTNFITKLNFHFAQYSQEHKSFYINDINYLSAFFGLEKWSDKRYWYNYKYALSYHAIPLLSHNISRLIAGIYGRTKKAITLDLDNTLWGGVIGDDGVERIKLGKDTPEGEAFTEFQKYLKELRSRGVLLTVCSKNDEEKAKEGFSHPDSVLKFEDLAYFVANWKPKPSNLESIIRKINLGPDAFVFVDDNPVERAHVQVSFPQVEVPNMSEDIVDFIDHIDGAKYFEPIDIVADDLQRNRYYKENLAREEFKSIHLNYDDFLRSLEMKAEIGAFKPMYFDRITQLTNKTNQFNFTTKRYTSEQISLFGTDKKYLTLYARLEDKYGDNGLVSVIVGSVEGTRLNIDLWLMSCRVINRTLEFAMIDELVKSSQERGIETIIGHYIPTKRNQMVAEKFRELGFGLVSSGDQGSVWELTIGKHYLKQNRFIKVGE